MTKTKSVAYDILTVITIFLSAIIGMILSLFISLGGITVLCRDIPHDKIPEVAYRLVVVFFLIFSLGVATGINHLIIRVFRSIFHCEIDECNSKEYADGFYVLFRSDQTREGRLSNLKADGPAGCDDGAYTVYLDMSYDELEVAIYRMLNKYKSAYYAIPHSHIMPDGVTCLESPKITLRAAMQAKDKMREDETVFFIYHVSYPERKSQLAHTNKHSEVVVIDTGDAS